MKVQELLTDETKWTRGEYALNAMGCPANPRAAGAVRWCLAGAIQRCYAGPEQLARFAAVRTIHADVQVWNDDPARTFAQVRELIVALDL